MHTLTAEALESALISCESEAIHQINQVQSHGALLVLGHDQDRTVLQASENAGAFLHVMGESLYGMPLVDIVGKMAALQINELIRLALEGSFATGKVKVINCAQELSLHAHVYFSDSQFVLELEANEVDDQDLSAELLLAIQNQLKADDHDADLELYLQKVTTVARSVFGFDRVMVYWFDENWDGKIIAEDKAGNAASYLGLSFPASDIPAQARRLYSCNLVRVLADLEAKPFKVLPVQNPITKKPLDMTYSMLRDMSLIHKQYLKDMSVRASMSISLMQKDKLWGLIVCHHHSRKKISILNQRLAICISHIVSASLAHKENLAKSLQLQKASSIINRLLQRINTDSLDDILKSLLPNLMKLQKASGIIVIVDGVRYVYGQLPTSEEIRPLLQWLGSQKLGEAFYCDQLGHHFEPAKRYQGIASGVLVTPIETTMHNGIVWLRKEKPKTVYWAGKQEKQLMLNEDGNYSLTPRESNEVWEETYLGRSLAWDTAEIEIAGVLTMILPKSFVQKNLVERAAAKQKQSAEDVISRNKKYYSLIRSMEMGFLHLDKNGRITEVNPGYCELSGYSEVELLGMHVSNLDFQGGSIKASQAILTTKKNEGKTFEAKHRRWDGIIWDVEIHSNHIESEENYFVVFLRDVTKKKQREHQIRKLARAVEQSSQTIIITNLYAEVEFVNTAFLKNTGYTIEEVLGQNLRILQSGKTSTDVYKELWETLSAQKVWRGEFINCRKDGSEYVESAIITAMTDANGRVTHFVSVQENITEKRQVESDLSVYKEQLEKLVAERTSQLEQAKQEAVLANKAKSLFLAHMSHEIRTPMNAIIGLSHLLGESKLSPEQKERLKMISTAADHLLTVINDILDLTKIEANEMVFEQASFDLHGLIDQATSIVEHQAAQKGINVIVEIANVLELLVGDSTRLRQIILNLLANAVKFTENGTIWLRAKLLEENKDGLFIRVEVQDTGIGIEEDKLPLIFEAFSQADDSTTRRYGGTGLGLSISKRLVEKMGGQIGVESVFGLGSLFWFTARLQRALPENIKERALIKQEHKFILKQRHRGANVLVVEDNPVNREVATALLNDVELIVDNAQDGFEAIAKIKQKNFDLILMDMQMPEMDGIECTKIIRLLPEFDKLPIVAMTANAFLEDRKTCLDTGMNDFVSKPVNMDELYSKILFWLSRPTVFFDKEHSQTESKKPQESSLSAEDKLSLIGGLDVMESMRRINCDTTKYISLLKLFASQQSDDMKRIEVELKSGNLLEASRLTHELKGVSAVLGAVKIRNYAEQLQLMLYNDSEITDCIALAKECDVELAQLTTSILKLN